MPEQQGSSSFAERLEKLRAGQVTPPPDVEAVAPDPIAGMPGLVRARPGEAQVNPSNRDLVNQLSTEMMDFPELDLSPGNVAMSLGSAFGPKLISTGLNAAKPALARILQSASGSPAAEAPAGARFLLEKGVGRFTRPNALEAERLLSQPQANFMGAPAKQAASGIMGRGVLKAEQGAFREAPSMLAGAARMIKSPGMQSNVAQRLYNAPKRIDQMAPAVQAAILALMEGNK